METSNVKNTQTLLKSVPGAQGRETRRQSVLNALFMEYITDLMSSGEVSRELLGRKIHIVGVKVSYDFTILNVRWAGGDPSEDETTQQILNRSAGPLRSELIGLKILGKVPQIQFVRDRTYSTTSDIDRALATADYGPDYVPLYKYQLEPIHVLHNHPSKESKETSPATWEDTAVEASQLPEKEQHDKQDLCSVSKVDKEQEDGKQELDSETGSQVSSDSKTTKMRQDVLGLKHDVLMTKVLDSVKRSKAQHRTDGNFQEEFVSTAQMDLQKSVPSDTQRFIKFLEDRRKKRMALKKKGSHDVEALNCLLDKGGDDDGGDGEEVSASADFDDDYFEEDRLVYEDSDVDVKDK